jgi:NAD(P)H-quinone oxidoreductase subunit 5
VLQIWLLSLVPLSIPGLLALSALCLNRRSSARPDSHTLGIIRLTTVFSALASAAVVLWLLLCATGLSQQSPGQLITLTPLRAVMLALVLGLAAVLLQFSRNYMAGESCYNGYFRWLLMTVAAVCLTVIANHLVLFVLGWASVSVSLHQLLTLYPERPRAVLAAHKKFILARIAELCVLGAALLLSMSHNSFYIDQILQAVAAAPALTLNEHLAAWLLGMAALIKCAQLPLHGWLIKVVEVPTPISALLHAGVINLGGFMLLVFAPLFARSELAQWWVLLVAGVSTVLSVLIMTTRISVKVRLAWSTSAQMGLMLMEIALGLYELALLHLLAHSLYKAHAFLSAGNAVNQHLEQTLLPAASSTSASNRAVAGIVTVFGVLCIVLCVVLFVIAAMWLTGSEGPLSPWSLLSIGLLSFALRSTTSTTTATSAAQALCYVIPLMLLLTIAYVLLKHLLMQLPEFAALRGVSALHAPMSAADLVSMLLFALIPLTAWLLHYKALHPRVQRLSALLFAGFYLDEWFTRMTLWLWPASLPRTQDTRPAFRSRRSVKSLLSTQESSR